MIVATLPGRLQTKLLTYVILGAVTAVFVLLRDPIYLWVCGVAIIVGLALETLWGLFIVYQSGWLTWVFAAIEFGVIVGVTRLFSVPLGMGAGLTFYLVVWILTQLFLLYILPVWRMSWSDDGAELW